MFYAYQILLHQIDKLLKLGAEFNNEKLDIVDQFGDLNEINNFIINRIVTHFNKIVITKEYKIKLRTGLA
jgi:hypothetical protein